MNGLNIRANNTQTFISRSWSYTDVRWFRTLPESAISLRNEKKFIHLHISKKREPNRSKKKTYFKILYLDISSLKIIVYLSCQCDWVILLFSICLHILVVSLCFRRDSILTFISFLHTLFLLLPSFLNSHKLQLKYNNEGINKLSNSTTFQIFSGLYSCIISLIISPFPLL